MQRHGGAWCNGIAFPASVRPLRRVLRDDAVQTERVSISLYGWLVRQE